MKRILVTLALILGLVGTAVAAHRPNWTGDRDPFRKAVASCVATVREWAKPPRFYGTPSIDAYVDSDHTAHWIGSEVERFQFRKCMVERGLFD